VSISLRYNNERPDPLAGSVIRSQGEATQLARVAVPSASIGTRASHAMSEGWRNWTASLRSQRRRRGVGSVIVRGAYEITACFTS
jgi:hypothetical protein